MFYSIDFLNSSQLNSGGEIIDIFTSNLLIKAYY